jgi:hypothetical protein
MACPPFARSNQIIYLMYAAATWIASRWRSTGTMSSQRTLLATPAAVRRGIDGNVEGENCFSSSSLPPSLPRLLSARLRGGRLCLLPDEAIHPFIEGMQPRRGLPPGGDQPGRCRRNVRSSQPRLPYAGAMTEMECGKKLFFSLPRAPSLPRLPPAGLRGRVLLPPEAIHPFITFMQPRIGLLPGGDQPGRCHPKERSSQ